MNDKINELAVKATLKHFPSFDNVVLYGDYSKSSYNKEIEDMMLVFAELIVKECCKIIKEEENDALNTFRYMGDSPPGRDYISEIKKHFGIKDE